MFLFWQFLALVSLAIYIYFFGVCDWFLLSCIRMVGLCNFVLMPISGGVQGLFVGFVHYVLEGLLTVTFLVIEPDIKLSLKHCKLSMTLVVCWRMLKPHSHGRW